MTIKDSGARHEYETGAVRDIQTGKGRCDLMPLQIIGEWLQDDVIEEIGKFMNTGDIDHLYDALSWSVTNNDPYQVAIELSKHFEEGAKKYGERNWEKGIPIDSYIDSAVRHYLKWNVGYEDEDHFIAFVWNIVCAIWTVEHMDDGTVYAVVFRLYGSDESAFLCKTNNKSQIGDWLKETYKDDLAGFHTYELLTRGDDNCSKVTSSKLKIEQ